VCRPLVIEVRNLVKDYQGLRPLRVEALEVAPGACIALSGLDAAAAEVFVNLLNGFSVPDQGDVRLFGQSTREIEDGDAWLASLDRLGLVTPRNVLLERVSVRQNLALPFTVQIEPLGDADAARAEAAGAGVGLGGEMLDRPADQLGAFDRMRLHVGRALALGPSLLLLEHPTLSLEAGDRAAFGTLVRTIAAARERRLTVVAVSEDQAFAQAIQARRLMLHPGTGRLTPAARGWRLWR
jgi:predicted ABC-type transport system involved in lysophospholipase L1 biosynthesis ATPase subunit